MTELENWMFLSLWTLLNTYFSPWSLPNRSEAQTFSCKYQYGSEFSQIGTPHFSLEGVLCYPKTPKTVLHRKKKKTVHHLYFHKIALTLHCLNSLQNSLKFRGKRRLKNMPTHTIIFMTEFKLDGAAKP